MDICFGIHFGNTNSCIALNKDNNVFTVENPSGDRITPSIVTFKETYVETGAAALRELVCGAAYTVGGMLRTLGITSSDEIIFPFDIKCQMISEKKKLKFVIQTSEGTRIISQEEVLKNIFGALQEIAKSHRSEHKLPAVLSLPSWINEAATATIIECAATSGFKILSVVNQPTAACLAYDLLDDNKKQLNVLTLHCGGTSVAAAVCEISGGLLTVKEYSAPSSVAGDALTLLIVNYLAKIFHQKFKGDPLDNRRSKRKLFRAAEHCKRVLSTVDTAQVQIDTLWESVDFSTNVSRSRFDELARSTLTEFLTPAKDVVQRSNLKNTQINKVVLTGGSCKIPKLQQLISDAFPQAEILNSLSADEVTAIGAAKEAGFHMGRKLHKHSSNPLLTVLYSSIYIIIAEGKSQLVFPAGSPTHSRQSFSFKCGQTPCGLVLYEARVATESPSDKTIIAQIDLNFSADDANIQLDFVIKSEGNIMATVLETTSKKSKTFIIESEKS